MKKKQAHGSDFSDEPSLVSEPVDLHFSTETKWDTIGFRMVHDSAYRVDRGGGWGSVPREARVAYRFSRGPAVRFGSLGFRLAREDT
jgi:formylglycine-generating enzyme required for sulfatase activity